MGGDLETGCTPRETIFYHTSTHPYDYRQVKIAVQRITESLISIFSWVQESFKNLCRGLALALANLGPAYSTIMP